MMSIFTLREKNLEPQSLEAAAAQAAQTGLWIDLLAPTAEEEKQVENLLKIDIPTREEMREIEDTSRFYSEGEVLYLTITIASATDTTHPINIPVTFILTPTHLITVRYSDPRPFSLFVERCHRMARPTATNLEVFFTLLGDITNRIADLLEMLQQRLDDISYKTFALGEPLNGNAPKMPAGALRETVLLLGRQHFFSIRLRECLLSISRMMTYLRNVKAAEQQGFHIRGIERDVISLSEYNAHINQEINFLLDATLGLISDRQNSIISVFSIVAVLFLPPTLVGTLYGMNFRFMPELSWPFGYPLALGLMLLSASIPYLFIRRKKLL